MEKCKKICFIYHSSFIPSPNVCISLFSFKPKTFINCFDSCPLQPSPNMVHLACISIPRVNVSLGDPSLAIPISPVETPIKYKIKSCNILREIARMCVNKDISFG